MADKTPDIVLQLDASLWHVKPIEDSDSSGIEVYVADENRNIAVVLRFDGFFPRPDTDGPAGVTIHEKSSDFAAEVAAYTGHSLS